MRSRPTVKLFPSTSQLILLSSSLKLCTVTLNKNVFNKHAMCQTRSRKCTGSLTEPVLQVASPPR